MARWRADGNWSIVRSYFTFYNYFYNSCSTVIQAEFKSKLRFLNHKLNWYLLVYNLALSNSNNSLKKHTAANNVYKPLLPSYKFRKYSLD